MNMLSCSMTGRNYAQRLYDDYADRNIGRRININFGVVEFNPENATGKETFFVNGMQFDMDVIHVERIELVSRTVYVLVGEPNRRSITVSVENGVATASVMWTF